LAGVNCADMSAQSTSAGKQGNGRSLGHGAKDRAIMPLKFRFKRRGVEGGGVSGGVTAAAAADSGCGIVALYGRAAWGTDSDFGESSCGCITRVSLSVSVAIDMSEEIDVLSGSRKFWGIPCVAASIDAVRRLSSASRNCHSRSGAITEANTKNVPTISMEPIFVRLVAWSPFDADDLEKDDVDDKVDSKLRAAGSTILIEPSFEYCFL
jgi:hypothetical protein